MLRHFNRVQKKNVKVEGIRYGESCSGFVGITIRKKYFKERATENSSAITKLETLYIFFRI